MAVEARVISSLQSNQESSSPVAVGVYNGELVVACPGGAVSDTHSSSRSSLAVHRVYNPTKEALILHGHHSSITALALSTSHDCDVVASSTPLSSNIPPPTFLCSASTDSLLLWNLDHCYEQHVAGGKSPCRELTWPSGREAVVQCVSFRPDAQYVVLCRGSEALVYNTKTCDLDTTLVGHTAAVTCAVFSPHNCDEVITVSEDRTFKIWDLSCSSLLYQSAVISASPFLCSAVALHGVYLATGTADGIIRIYDLSKHQGFKILHKFDVANELKKWSSVTSEEVVSGRVIQSSSQQQPLEGATPGATIEVGAAILGLFYWPQPPSELTFSPTSEVLRAFPLLLAVTHFGLLSFNAQTMELVSIVNFKDTRSVQGTQCSTPTTATCSFSCNPLTNEVCCTLGAMFNSSVSTLVLSTNQHQQDGVSKYLTEFNAEGLEAISVLSSTPLVQNSPLSAEFSFKSKSTTTAVSKNYKGINSKSHLHVSSLNQPLTFKSKVKSSGYSEAPKTKMFTPKTSFKKALASSPRNSKVGDLKKQEYPMNSSPVTQLTHSMSLTDRPTAIYSATFSGNGQYLACGCADKAAYTVKMPPSSGRVHAFVGHDGEVLSICWNHSGQWLLTCSMDKTARVWSLGHKDPLLNINTVRHNMTAHTTKDSKANNPFVKEISSAKFYYLDKFLLLTSGSGLYLYKYHIDISKPDDIKRYLSESRYKLVTTLSMDSAQTITAMSTINDFHSYIVLVGGSNKAIEVFDMNVGSSVRTIAAAHNRAVHCIHQNNGSRYSSLPSSAYDIFLTSAVTDGIKLWDLRASRCVCRFTSHINMSFPVSAAISPCARFIATGSEDRAVYVYDIRYPSPLHKLSGHSDVVTTVTYHPLRPMLASATVDGKISFLAEEQVK